MDRRLAQAVVRKAAIPGPSSRLYELLLNQLCRTEAGPEQCRVPIAGSRRLTGNMPGDNFKQDIRYTLRTLRRDAGFFSAAVLIIGLGIGVNTAMFSVVNTLLFLPLRFTASDRLVWIANTGADGGLSSVTSLVANYLDWRSLHHSFHDMTS